MKQHNGTHSYYAHLSPSRAIKQFPGFSLSWERLIVGPWREKMRLVQSRFADVV